MLHTVAPGTRIATIIGSIALGVGVALFSVLNPDVGALAVVGSLVLAASLALAGSRAGVRSLSLVRSMQWWDWLWVALFFSGLTWRVRSAVEIYAEPLDVYALVRIGVVGAVGLVALARILTTDAEALDALRRPAIAFLSAFAVFGLFTTLWSVYPEWTLYKSVEYLVDILVLLVVLSRLRSLSDVARLANVTWLCLGMLVVSVWAGVVAAPGIAILRHVGPLGMQIQGVWPALSANTVGDLGAILAVVGLHRILTRKTLRGVWASVAALGVVTALFAQSRSPLIALVAGGLLVFVLERKALSLVGAGVLAALVSTSSFVAVIVEYMRRGQSAEMLTTLSGRVYFWKYLWELFLASPVAGYGAYAGGRFAVLAAMGYALTSSVHNSYLEVMIGTGIVGLFLLVGALVSVSAGLTRALSRLASDDSLRSLVVEVAALFLLELMRAFFSSGPLIWHPATRFLLVIAVVEYATRHLRREGGDARD